MQDSVLALGLVRGEEGEPHQGLVAARHLVGPLAGVEGEIHDFYAESEALVPMPELRMHLFQDKKENKKMWLRVHHF